MMIFNYLVIYCKLPTITILQFWCARALTGPATVVSSCSTNKNLLISSYGEIS